MRWLAALVVLLACSCAVPPANSPARRVGHGERRATAARDGHTSFAALGSQVILLAALKYPPPATTPVAPPVSLTTSDGTGLALASYEARSVVDGPLAFTELRLSFRNPRNRVLEGRFQVRLPAEAAVSRLAMRIDDRWQEAEVVERTKARRTYEDFLHRKQDPALLERRPGNTIAARIFPIPARATKDIILSYSHPTGRGGTTYRLPLRGLPEVDQLTATVRSRAPGGKLATHRFAERHHEPRKDLLVPLGQQPRGLRHRDLVAVRITPRLAAGIEPLRRIAVLFDTSASRAPGFTREVERLGTLVTELTKLHGEDVAVELATFDQEVSLIYTGPLGGLGTTALEGVLARRPLGASDHHRALSWLARRDGVDRGILMTDGVATAGPVEAGKLRKVLRRARGKVTRLDVVLGGGVHREMARLVVGPLERDGVVLDGALPSAALARRISQDTRSGVTIHVPGARWRWPERLDGLQPGADVLIFARLAEAPRGGKRSLDVRLGGSLDDHWSVPLVDTSGPLLERAVAGAAIARLTDRRATLDGDTARRQSLRQRIVDLSIRHRVLSDFTALLVLETEEDYRRYGIDRKGLRDVLTVGPTGIETRRPTPPVVAPAATGRLARRQPEQLDTEPCLTCFRRPPPGGSAAPSSGSVRIAGPSSSSGHGYEFADDPLTAGGFGPQDATIRVRPGPVRLPSPTAAVARHLAERMETTPPYSGRMATVMDLVEVGSAEQAVIRALAWRNDEPGDVLALVALGEALEARGNLGLAARAYGSIYDLHPARADMRRFAAGRLERLDGYGSSLAIDGYQKAVADRPDHLSGHRLLGYALLRQGRHEEALAAMEAAFGHLHRSRVTSAAEVLREDLGLIGAAWARQSPEQRAGIAERLARRRARLATEPSLRFVLTWETDANDVDLHVFDGQAGHAYYSSPRLASGGLLYHDVTNGYGPECFAVHGPDRAFPYRLAVHYYSRGPMGYGMGKVEVIAHDGQGRLHFDQRPFVVMNDDAFVDLGVVTGKSGGTSAID